MRKRSNHKRLHKRLVLAGLLLCLSAAWGEPYPNRPLRLVVGFPAGQSTDVAARRIAQKMGEILGQVVVVDNKVGASGIISHEFVKTAPPDGYTLLMGSQGPLAINPTLYQKLSYDPIRDFAAVVRVTSSPLLLFTAASSPVHNVKDLISYAKSRPGQINYGSPGTGTGAHIAMEMLKQAAGINMSHIPYKGAPSMITDIIAGRVEFAFDSASSIIPMAKNGRVRLLSVTTAERSAAYPEIPTVAEQGIKGFEATGWTIILVPKGTPTARINTLNAAVNKALNDPEVVAAYGKTGVVGIGGTSAEAQQFLLTEIARWGKAVKASGARAD